MFNESISNMDWNIDVHVIVKRGVGRVVYLTAGLFVLCMIFMHVDDKHRCLLLSK